MTEQALAGVLTALVLGSIAVGWLMRELWFWVRGSDRFSRRRLDAMTARLLAAERACADAEEARSRAEAETAALNAQLSARTEAAEALVEKARADLAAAERLVARLQARDPQ